MKPSSSPDPHFEQLWAQLPQHLAKPLPDGLEHRFWQRFEQELGEEEQRRQHHALQTKSSQIQQLTPQDSGRSNWRSWPVFSHAFSYGLWASATAACVLVIWMYYPGKPSPLVSHPTSISQSSATQSGQHPSPSPNKTVLSSAVKITSPQAIPVRSLDAPSPEQSPALYQDLALYEKMEILEKMHVLEQLPTLTKGS